MTTPASSLIISTYNWPQALDLCLMSVQRQVVLPNEIIIADDGSREDTRKLIAEYQQQMPVPIIHVWHEDTGFRLAAIRNKAISKASGDYIIQIDGDIILHPYYIADHLRFAQQGYFVSGSRILLSEEFSIEVMKSRNINISPWSRGVKNHLNGVRCVCFQNFLRTRYKKNEPFYVKGCNMAFWRSDLLKVNGYNEDMTGWGREDSELAARLINSGVKRQFLKFGGIEYHIYHKENSRERELINTKMMQDAIDLKIKIASNGLDKYL